MGSHPSRITSAVNYLVTETQSVTPRDQLKLQLALDGGFVVKLEPEASEK